MKRFAILVISIVGFCSSVADDEILMGSGYEPSVSANRQYPLSSNHNRVTVDYMYDRGSSARIRRRISDSQGSSTSFEGQPDAEKRGRQPAH